MPARSYSVRVIVLTFHPSLGTARRKRGRTPHVSTRSGTAPPGRHVAAAQQHAGPAVETRSPCLPPRGARRAVGGRRAWGERIRAAGPAHLRLYSHWDCLHTRIQKSPELLRAHRQTPANRRSVPPATPPSNHGLMSCLTGTGATRSLSEPSRSAPPRCSPARSVDSSRASNAMDGLRSNAYGGRCEHVRARGHGAARDVDLFVPHCVAVARPNRCGHAERVGQVLAQQRDGHRDLRQG
jgi:hypothetical protein